MVAVACGGGAGAPAGAGADGGGPDAAPDAGPPPTVLPEELADEAALATLSRFATLPTLRSERREQASSTDRGVGEPEIALLQNGNRDLNDFVCASDDAQIAEPYLVEPVLDLPECPEPWVTGFVLGRFEGAGTLVRFWMTALSLREQPADRETVRIYVDDERDPVLQAPLASLLDGSAGEMFAPPFGAGATTHLAWHYPVVFGSRLIVTLDRLGALDLYYHQLDVRLDADPGARTRREERLAARDEAIDALEGPATVSGGVERFGGSVAAGSTEVVLSRGTGGTIRELRVRVPTTGALESLRLEARWDGSTDPAVALSLAELFAAVDEPPQGDGLVLSGHADASGIELAIRLPMPFRESAEVALTNTGASSIDVDVQAAVEDGLPAEPFGLLHAQRSESTEPVDAHPIASASGPGRLVGTCLMLAGHGLDGGGATSGPFNFLEGDEELVVDGRTIRGTGTEDYLNSAFYFREGAFTTPFARVWGIVPDDGAGGARVTGCRWHVLGDAIDFESSVSLELEVGPGDPTLLDRYLSVAWLYL